jgi:hypothetical protein
MYNTISLFSEPYYNPFSQCYSNIITLNLPPRGPLLKLTRRIRNYPLSPFKIPTNCGRIQTCGIGLSSLRGLDLLNGVNSYNNELMTVDEVPDLFSFLISHGYKIDTSVTKMLNQSSIRFKTNKANELIAMISYDK